jgi:hypothetical protein
MYVMDWYNYWEEYLPLVEFVYKNNYWSSIKVRPFNFLYGRTYKTPLSWDILEDKVAIGPEMIQEM